MFRPSNSLQGPTHLVLRLSLRSESKQVPQDQLETTASVSTVFIPLLIVLLDPELQSLWNTQVSRQVSFKTSCGPYGS